MAGRGRAYRRFSHEVVAAGAANDTPCCRCGGAIDYTLKQGSRNGPSADHIDPLMQGGELIPDIETMGVAHGHCNSRHGARMVNSSRQSMKKNQEESVAKGDRFAPQQTDAADLGGSLTSPSSTIEMESIDSITPAEGDGGPFVSVNGVIPEIWNSVPWMADLLDVPEDATWPRLMSAPHPRAVGTLGPQVVKEMEARRRADPLTPYRQRSLRWWQKLLVYRMYEIDIDGNLCWKKILNSTSRQVGKSVALREVALHRMCQHTEYGESQLVLHVAKDLSIADEIQRPARQWANLPENQPLWHGINGNGRWAVEHSGIMGRWLVRAQTSVYGYSASLALIDEAWAIDTEHITEGLEPTMVEREQSQMLMVSTAHREATDLFPDLRTTALACLDDPQDDVLLIEWSAPPGADKHHIASHRAASPHWDDRRAAFIRSKVEQRGFEEQWLNIWPSMAGQKERLAPIETIMNCVDSALKIPVNAQGRCFIIHPDADQRRWHLLIGGVEGENTLIQYVDDYPSLRAAVKVMTVEAAKGVSTELLIPRYIRGRIPRIPGIRGIINTNESDVAAATTMLRPLLAGGNVRHSGAEVLVQQMGAAVLERYGDTVRISSRLTGAPVEVAKAAVLVGWWAAREDKPTAVVV